MQVDGAVVVEKVAGKSAVTRCFSKYPLKFIIPRKVGPSKTDAIWIYSLNYGGGIVSGDSISCELTVKDGCTVILTTQSSTKVYKSRGEERSEQLLEARIGNDALLAVLPDPVTCFATARPKVKNIQDQVRENVKKMMSDQLHSPFTSARGAQMNKNSDHLLNKPGIIASSSVFGPMGIGTVVRIAAMETETVYRFLQQQLASMEPLLGVPPYK